MKSFIVLVFMIFTLTGFAKADGWTNAGEFSYLYPNGTKQITDYTLTEDGKSILVITAEGNNLYRINKFNLETGIVEFDSLLVSANNHRFVLSTDGLTAFDVAEVSLGHGYYTDYKLFDIYHSSRGYLYQDILVNETYPSAYISLDINFINFISKNNLLLYGYRTYKYRYYIGGDPNNSETTNSGAFNIFSLSDTSKAHKYGGGNAEIYDIYNGMEFVVFSKSYYNSNPSGSESEYALVLVDNDKKITELFKNSKLNIPKLVKLSADSLLLIHLPKNYINTLLLYDIKSKIFKYKYEFPYDKKNDENNSIFKIGFSNDGKYFAKSDSRLQIFKSYLNYPVYEMILPDTINKPANYKFTNDDKYIITINNKNQLVRFENKIKSNTLTALFGLSDSVLLAGRTYQTYNCSTGNPNSYSWDFGNSSTSNEFEPEVKFDISGQYIINLTVGRDGKYSSQEKVVTVLPDFKVDFEIVSIPEYLPIICKFKNTSTDNIDSLVWDFGDGTYSKLKDINIDHQYAKESEYNVKLKVYYKKFSDSIEKKVTIKEIKEAPLDPNIYSEYNFENTTQNHQKLYKVFETKDDGFILVALNKDITTLYKTKNDFVFHKSIVLNIPQYFDGTRPGNINEIYFDNTLKYNDNCFIFSYREPYYRSSIDIYDAQLNRTNIIDSLIANLLAITFRNNIPDQNIIVLQTWESATINKYNIITGVNNLEKNNLNFSLIPSHLYNFINKYHELYSSFAPISNNYSYFSSYTVAHPYNGSLSYLSYSNSSLNLKKDVYFYAFRNIDTNTFVGLDINGNIYKFNANGDSLNKIALTKGLRNIAVNGSLYYAVGFKDNHPVCYTFDNDLNMKDTIYIEQRDGAFLDALVCKSGDLVLAGYKYIPSKTDTAGKLLRSSYILRINKYTAPLDTTKVIPKDTTKAIPIAITNPIDHLATIRFAVDSSATFHYEAYNLLGNLVFKTANEKIEKEYTGTVDFSGLAPGVYIFKFYINGKIVTKKVIYQK